MHEDQQEPSGGHCRPTGQWFARSVQDGYSGLLELPTTAVARDPDVAVGLQCHAGRGGRLMLVLTTTNNFAVPWSRREKGAGRPRDRPP
jgi:hypothetical protein